MMEIDCDKEIATVGYTEQDMRDPKLILMERKRWRLIGEWLIIVGTALGLAVVIVLWLIYP